MNKPTVESIMLDDLKEIKKDVKELKTAITILQTEKRTKIYFFSGIIAFLTPYLHKLLPGIFK